ncbi:hypothetical protein [Streptomyces sp. NPDC057686]|uniref:hypothetical protein n=1 Tax=Streptomyces sp. NPDC057686 TaxID=3346212 RepID=UPI0036D1358F
MEYRVSAGEEFARVAAALRTVDSRLPGDFREELKRAVRPLVARAKEKVRNLPVHGVKHTGLRRRVAAGVGMRVSTSRNPGIRVTTSMRDPSEASLPHHLDDPRGWRHPVFGNRHVWVTQHTGGAWFSRTIADGRDDIARDLHGVLERAAETVADAGGRV